MSTVSTNFLEELDFVSLNSKKARKASKKRVKKSLEKKTRQAKREEKRLQDEKNGVVAKVKPLPAPKGDKSYARQLTVEIFGIRRSDRVAQRQNKD